MHIKIINPNTSAIFTERNLVLGRAVAAPGTLISAGQPAVGTASVECHVEEAIGTIGVVEEVLAGERDGVDGYVIACFGDTGIHAAREAAGGPVVGMTEASLFAAALIAHKFSIVTLPSRTRIQAERVIRELGMSERCGPVRAIDVDVLDCEDEDAAIGEAFLVEARRAAAEDHAEAIILGCAGLSPLVQPLTEALGIPVIEGVSVAVKLAEGLVALGLRTSKVSSFGYPPAKPRSSAFFGGAWGQAS
jgi:allantoin racemase